MSRIAKLPIIVPSDVKVKISEREVTITGPKGKLKFLVHPSVRVFFENGFLRCEAIPGYSEGKAQSGTARAVLNNMVVGVQTLFEKRLQLVGVGYRAQAQPGLITMSLGFSHPIHYRLPEEVQVEMSTQTELVLKSFDKALLGQVAAQIRAFRPPEPYKGKGVHYLGEKVRLKEAKKK